MKSSPLALATAVALLGGGLASLPLLTTAPAGPIPTSATRRSSLADDPGQPPTNLTLQSEDERLQGPVTLEAPSKEEASAVPSTPPYELDPDAISPKATVYPPIYITVNAHGHNYGFQTNSSTLAAMKQVKYDAHREEVRWLAKESQRVGAKMSYQLNGEYARDARLAADARHIKALRRRGHSVGVHFHAYLFSGVNEFWEPFGAGAGYAELRQAWENHVGEVKRAVGGKVLRVDPGVGDKDQNELLYAEFGVEIEPGGEPLSYTDWNIKPWNPYRREVGTTMTEDPNGPRVAVVSIGQVGKEQPEGKHAIYCTAAQLKRHFLMLLAEWRRHERSGDAPRIWSFGIMTHPGDNFQYRDDMTDMLEWLAEFTHASTPRGTPIAEFVTDAELVEVFKQWEQDNPGASSFSFDWEAELSGVPQPYPYDLEGVTLGLKDSELEGELSTWSASGVVAYELKNREILRGSPNPITGQRSITGIGETRESVYLLWSDSGAPVTIDFTSQVSGFVFVKSGETGVVYASPSAALLVPQAPIVVSKTRAYF